jgi:hypothetical protein
MDSSHLACVSNSEGKCEDPSTGVVDHAFVSWEQAAKNFEPPTIHK